MICIFTAILMIAAFAGCAKEQEAEISTEPAGEVFQSETESTTKKAAETSETTTAETTTAETTTAAPDGSSIQGLIDTLEGKRFYLSGTMNLNGGQTIDAKATCDGDNYRLEMTSRQMNMSFIYIDGVPYVVNNSTNMYVVIDEAAINSMDQVMSGFSSFGLSFNSTDISDMKNMMSNFDTNMDFSQYIEGGEYSEYTKQVDGQEYLCSSYKTEYGSINIYTQDGALKILDVFDPDGLRQMNFVVSAFIPEILTPISLNGLTKSTSIVNLFTATG